MNSRELGRLHKIPAEIDDSIMIDDIKVYPTSLKCGGHTLLDYPASGMSFLIRDATCDKDVVTSIVREGEYDDLMPNYQIPETGVVVDIGSYIGAFVVSWLVRHPGWKGLAIEPLPENIEMIKMNASRNQVGGNLEVLQGAVGTGGSLVISYSDTTIPKGAIHEFIGNASGLASTKQVQVDVYTLREILERVRRNWGNQTIDVIKVDTEGGEVGFLSRAASSELTKVNWLIGEYHQGFTSIPISKLAQSGFNATRGLDNGKEVDLFSFKNTGL